MNHRALRLGGRLAPGEPLWRRVPTEDERGRPLSDFMMLIPKIGSWAEMRREQAYRELEALFEEHRDRVVFADLNLKLSLLWVSVKPGKGSCVELAAAVRKRIPEAVLVASHSEVLMGEQLQTARRQRQRRLR